MYLLLSLFRLESFQQQNYSLAEGQHFNMYSKLHKSRTGVARPVPAGLISISHLCVFNIHTVRSLLLFSVFYVISPHSLPVVIPLFSFFK